MIVRNISVFISIVALALASSFALADSPKNVIQPDRHSVEVTGKISMYRVQVEGMDLGEGKNKANAEVFVSLSGKPKIVYTLSIKKGDPESNQVMANTLRDAYLHKLPVKLYHQIAINKDNNFKILMVQLGK